MIKSHFLLDEQRLQESEPTDLILEQPAICRALLELRNAYHAASACGRDPWEFATGISQLFKSGISTQILRTLVCRTWITHLQRIYPSANSRVNSSEYETESKLVFSNLTCFVLTPQGLEIADKLAATGMCFMNSDSDSEERSKTTPDAAPYPGPCWDRKRRELSMGDVVVKRFRWPAENQEQILDAFQEEGWPSRIDDPLIRDEKVCPKRRLHDTLKCLNRKQISEVIKFRGDGTGQGVLLEINWDGDGNSQSNGASKK